MDGDGSDGSSKSMSTDGESESELESESESESGAESTAAGDVMGGGDGGGDAARGGEVEEVRMLAKSTADRGRLGSSRDGRATGPGVTMVRGGSASGGGGGASTVVPSSAGVGRSALCNRQGKARAGNGGVGRVQSAAGDEEDGLRTAGRALHWCGLERGGRLECACRMPDLPLTTTTSPPPQQQQPCRRSRSVGRSAAVATTA
jgi:hypothetical protein